MIAWVLARFSSVFSDWSSRSIRSAGKPRSVR